MTGKEALALMSARTALAHATYDVPESAFHFGGGMDVLFPVGRADRMYIVAEEYPHIDLPNRPLVLISCWTFQKKKLHREWKVWFKPTVSKPWKPFKPRRPSAVRPRGTLSLIADGCGVDAGSGTKTGHFVADTKSKDWNLARVELNYAQTLICYDFADSVAPYYGNGYLVFPDGKPGDQLPEANVIETSEPLPMTRAELDIINARRRKK